MAFLGNQPAAQFTTIPTVQRFNGTGSATEFTLDRAVTSVQSIMVSVDGVIQDTSSYTIPDGVTLTFSSAPSSGTGNIFINYLGLVLGTVTHPSTSSLSATSGTFSGALTTSGAFTSLGIDDNADANAITIDSSENVAIGSTDPQGFPLQVNSGGAGNIVRFTDGTNANAVIKTSGSTTTFGPDTTNSLVLQTNSVERVNINTSGLAQFKSSGIGAGSQVFQVIDDGATLFQIRAEDGNVSFPQSGAGIYLGVTAGTASNLLNDYEEGTWTPIFQSGGASFGYSSQGGTYTKVGRLILASFRLALSGSPSGTTSNSVVVGGLPFTTGTLNQTYHGGAFGHYFAFNLSQTGVLVYQLASGSGTVELKVVGDNLGETAVVASNLNSNAEIRGQIVYHTV
tara:strand:+ start:4527 stop:5717 length:1191 start_codon:yes stop_codon:yes gene_type:complete